MTELLLYAGPDALYDFLYRGKTNYNQVSEALTGCHKATRLSSLTRHFTQVKKIHLLMFSRD